ncbi:beta-hexosaminidase 2, BETA-HEXOSAMINIDASE 3 [Hibiscus trionum]|uniref:Beta-hexosaminidase n=1 Tax=Hibiscus trionum TaxID=183268 RepID=A0A9W7LVU5_HIBTR|nr:beta-hexosaminidase 2, BETA-HEXOSAMINIDASE 3 [Hibiscus trionum]
MGICEGKKSMSRVFVPPISKFATIICLTLIFPPPTLSLKSAVNVWPKPRLVSWPRPLAKFLSANFTIDSPYHQHLTPAINRYLGLVRTEHYHPLVTPFVTVSASVPPLQTLSINITNLAVPLQHGANETYSLSISEVGETAYLTAETAWGAMRGLETFSQLVWGDPPAIPVGLYIWDAPLFAHRGIMLDTSRNYYGVEDILRTIEAMSANKLNVFHWHITDSHSFPLMVPSEPELAAKGSYGLDMIYSPSDVAKIVQFGLEHGVRVLPEIDSPGHTGSWAEAYPEIVACANMFWLPGSDGADQLAAEPGTGHLNPLNQKTYKVLENVIRDASNMFPETFYHGGADEIIPGCWKADPTIQSFLSNGGTLSQLLEKFINSTLPYIISLNRTVVYWEDVLLNDVVKVDSSFLPREHTILQTWNNGSNNTNKIVEAGYRTIVSSAEFYYLDCGHGNFLGNNSQYDPQTTGHDSKEGASWCDPFKTWQTIYNYDITFGLSKDEAKLVLGGEVALWSEQADPTVLDGRLWPRTSAMAETLWSGNRDEGGRKRSGEATDRLNEWRYRMVSRGVKAEPIQPLWCIRNPGMCNAVQSF